MKKIMFFILLFLFSINSTFAENKNIEDSSIINELNKKINKKEEIDFKLKNFKSCDDLKFVMEKYIKEYWKNNKKRYIEPPMILYDTISMENSLDSNTIIKDRGFLPKTGGGPLMKDYSRTNTQIKGVDESDIVKTDGNYIYYFNSKWENNNRYVYILDSNKLEILKKIKIPRFFNNIQLYLKDNKLIILSNGYSKNSYKGYWINKNNKTYSIIYDITDKKNIILKKLFILDGFFKKSRLIGNKLYLISENYFDIPYYSFKKENNIKLDTTKIIPKKIEITKTNKQNRQNLKIGKKIYPYNIKAGKVVKCNEIEYILPTNDTLNKYGFNPSYNIVSIINIDNLENEVKTKVIAGDISEIYMSLNNLYLTDKIYFNEKFDCLKGDYCVTPYYSSRTTNTLIHKFSISGNSLEYKNSNLIPGRPLNQYSMDEKDGKFRIITTTNIWDSKSRKSHTDLYILDENLKLYSSLNNLGENEVFQSSRFIGDKLFLVTFKRIDPLFVIDLKNQKNPKVIGELKIPGYSKYLHPYDENHLIGLGYDTYRNKWGGTSNGGLKIDLYEINYDKKIKSDLVDCTKFNFEQCPNTCIKNKCASACNSKTEICTLQCVEKCENPKNLENGNKDYIEVKQLYSLVLGDTGSRTEAMNNPRMFMWNSNKNLLFLPASIYINESKNSYKHKDFFQGLITLKIDKKTGIKELYRITHINYKNLEEKRRKECKKIIEKKKEKEECKTLIDGTKYCPPKSNYYYIPQYCYANSTIGTYIANKSRQFKNDFIKRALWINENLYSISNNKVMENDITTGIKKGEVLFY